MSVIVVSATILVWWIEIGRAYGRKRYRKRGRMTRKVDADDGAGRRDAVRMWYQVLCVRK